MAPPSAATTMSKRLHKVLFPDLKSRTSYTSSTNTSFGDVTAQYPTPEHNFQDHHNQFEHDCKLYHSMHPPFISLENDHVAPTYDRCLRFGTNETGPAIEHQYGATFSNSLSQHAMKQAPAAMYAGHLFPSSPRQLSTNLQPDNIPRARAASRQDDSYANAKLRTPFASPQQQTASHANMCPTYIALSTTGSSQTLDLTAMLPPAIQSYHETSSAVPTPYVPAATAQGLPRRASEPWRSEDPEPLLSGYSVHSLADHGCSQVDEHYSFPPWFDPNSGFGSVQQQHSVSSIHALPDCYVRSMEPSTDSWQRTS